MRSATHFFAIAKIFSEKAALVFCTALHRPPSFRCFCVLRSSPCPPPPSRHEEGIFDSRQDSLCIPATSPEKARLACAGVSEGFLQRIPIPEPKKTYHPIQRCACALLAALFCLSSLQAEERQFLVISDIHFNVFNDLDKGEFQKLAGMDVSDWPSFFEELNQPVVELGKDSNYTLMVSALAAAAKRFPDSSFVIFPGDFMGHDWQAKYDALASQTVEEDPAAYRAFTSKALQLIAKEFREHFPASTILPTLGNDDAFCSDYWIQPNGAFLKVFGEIWLPLMKDAADPAKFRESFRALGCYVADLPTFPNHRLIALNSVLWSDSYCDVYHDPIESKSNCCECSNLGATPGEAQFAWLERKLAAAKAAGKIVWLLMHVPPGLDSYTEARSGGQNAAAHFWTTDFTARYLDLLGQYRDTIQVSFAGHTHKDDYRIDKIDGLPVLLHKIIPAVSPIFGNNPAIQVYHADSTTGDLINWQTHYLSLEHPNDEAPARNWSDEYDARETYGLDHFNAETVSGLFEAIRTHPDSPHARSYRRFWQMSASVIPQDDLPVYTCAVLNSTFSDYHRCLIEHGLPAPVQIKSPAKLRRMAGGLPDPGQK